MDEDSKLCVSYYSHPSPPAVFQLDLFETVSLSLSLSKKLALGKKWNGLRLILRPLHPLEGCWLPLADALDPLSLKVQHSAVMC